MSKRESEKSSKPEAIKKSLDDIVQKLDKDAGGSKSWGDSISSNREKWERVKTEIHDRQKALKQIVMDKKAGIIGVDEFEAKYKKLQDELTELELIVYNMRLGTKVQ
ncbi:MAG: hypothetical protein ACFFDQ_02310 [Candidatus Thorarchaeota archaeon]